MTPDLHSPTSVADQLDEIAFVSFDDLRRDGTVIDLTGGRLRLEAPTSAQLDDPLQAVEAVLVSRLPEAFPGGRPHLPFSSPRAAARLAGRTSLTAFEEASEPEVAPLSADFFVSDSFANLYDAVTVTDQADAGAGWDEWDAFTAEEGGPVDDEGDDVVLTLDEARIVLGVADDATWGAISHRYRELAKVHHPDHAGDDPEARAEAEERMRTLNVALDRLRSAYGR